MGVWKGGVMGESLKQEYGWVNIMEICFCGNWVCAWNGPWRFPGGFLSWILGLRCSGVSGWKYPDRPCLGDLDGPLFGKYNERELGA